MDIFMDKLAQKATAQEIIKANTAADMEELNRLRNQIVEYNECLTKLQKLIDDGSGKLEDMQSEDGAVRGLVEESQEGIRTLQKLVQSLVQGQKSLGEQLAVMDKAMASRLEFATGTLEERFDGLNGLTEEQLAEKLSVLEENVHKECVKVYRNVQAVVTEESGKQNEALAEAKKEASSAGGRIGAVLGISVAALVFSLAGLVFQVLARLGVLPF